MLLPVCKTRIIKFFTRTCLTVLALAIVLADGCKSPSRNLAKEPASLNDIPYRPLKSLLPERSTQTQPMPDIWQVSGSQPGPLIYPSLDITTQRWGMMLHLVRPKDTLYQLAIRYYGDVKYWRTIYQHNREKLESKDQLQPGQLLYLPLNPRADTSEKITPPLSRPDYYIVDKGDSLSRIAEKILGDGQKSKLLLAANRDQLTDPHKLTPGLLLVIPTSN